MDITLYFIYLPILIIPLIYKFEKVAISYVLIPLNLVIFLLCLQSFLVSSNNIYESSWSWVIFLNADLSWYSDSLARIMLLLITLISLIVQIYSQYYMDKDKNIAKFFIYLILFTAFMELLVTANNFLQLFLAWELMGAMSYILVSFWHENEHNTQSALKVFLINKFADIFMILGILIIFANTGSVNFDFISSNIRMLTTVTVDILGVKLRIIDLSTLLIIIGCIGKSAQLFFSVWLPSAMAAPTPVSALLHSATMVTSGVFLLIKCSFLLQNSDFNLFIIQNIGTATSIICGLIAANQLEIKKILAYSTCSQLGFMFFAIGIECYDGALFHLVVHGMFKSSLFICAGNFMKSTGESDVTKMHNIRKILRIDFICFTISILGMCGMYPLSGFFSKEYILNSAINNGSLASAIIIALITAIYSLRLLRLVAFNHDDKSALDNGLKDNNALDDDLKGTNALDDSLKGTGVIADGILKVKIDHNHSRLEKKMSMVLLPLLALNVLSGSTLESLIKSNFEIIESAHEDSSLLFLISLSILFIAVFCNFIGTLVLKDKYLNPLRRCLYLDYFYDKILVTKYNVFASLINRIEIFSDTAIDNVAEFFVLKLSKRIINFCRLGLTNYYLISIYGIIVLVCIAIYK